MGTNGQVIRYLGFLWRVVRLGDMKDVLITVPWRGPFLRLSQWRIQSSMAWGGGEWREQEQYYHMISRSEHRDFQYEIVFGAQLKRAYSCICVFSFHFRFRATLGTPDLFRFLLG